MAENSDAINKAMRKLVEGMFDDKELAYNVLIDVGAMSINKIGDLIENTGGLIDSLKHSNLDNKNEVRFQLVVKMLQEIMNEANTAAHNMAVMAVKSRACSAADISRLYNVSQSTVSRWMNEGEIMPKKSFD